MLVIPGGSLLEQMENWNQGATGIPRFSWELAMNMICM